METVTISKAEYERLKEIERLANGETTKQVFDFYIDTKFKELHELIDTTKDKIRERR